MIGASKAINISINRNEVCQYLGYRKEKKLPTHISSLVDSQISQAYELIEPSYSSVIKKVRDVKGSQIFIEGYLVFRSNIIARMFSKCHEVVIFLATIGPKLERKVSQLMNEGEILKAVVLDAVGSEAVEEVTCLLEGRLRERAMAGDAKISLRYSPGYCDWDITQQKALFRAFDGNSLRVKLTEGCLMIPRKSVSGIIGIGLDHSITLSPCLSCNKKDCPSRRL